jgi:hypothetical protein
MKRVVVLLIGFVTTVNSFAQLSLGVQGTGNLSDAHVEIAELASYTKKAKILPGAGLVADLALSPSLTVRSGINFLQQGATFKATLEGTAGEIEEMKIKTTHNLRYLQVPFNVLYTTQGRGIQLFAGGGPYASFAVSGISKLETTYKFSDGTVTTEKEETDPFEKDEDGNASFKRFDYGIGVLAGVKFSNSLFASVGYQYSLANINDGDANKYKNRGLQLSVGYYLWRK